MPSSDCSILEAKIVRARKPFLAPSTDNQTPKMTQSSKNRVSVTSEGRLLGYFCRDSV